VLFITIGIFIVEFLYTVTNFGVSICSGFGLSITSGSGIGTGFVLVPPPSD
jgi:hypothetical protein